MVRRVGPKGQVVIPKQIRDDLGIEPGDEVSIRLEGDHVVMQRAGRPLRWRFRGSGLVDELERDRAVERDQPGAASR